MYMKSDVRFRIQLPQKVITWLGNGGDDGVTLSPAQHARLIIIQAYTKAQQRK